MADENDDVCTPNDTLIKCLEEFGESECQNVIVVFTNQDGKLVYRHNIPIKFTELIGMLSLTEAKITEEFMCGDDDDD